jgi:hypothetical protein
MKVRCIANRLTQEQKKILGLDEGQNPQYQVSKGINYLVLGICFMIGNNHRNGIMYEIIDDVRKYSLSIPACLFEIVDSRPSKYWQAKGKEGMSLTLWPEEFYDEYFFDDLTEDIESVQKTFDIVVEKMKAEFEVKDDNSEWS